jgi:hypothetical protein
MVRAVHGEPSLQRIAIEPVRRVLGAGRLVPLGHAIGIAMLAGAPALLIGVLAWPMLFTSAALNGDWLHHLWLIWSQSQAIRADHHPSLFLNYSHSVLYPQYAFYGATIYAIAGTLSLLLGGAPIAIYVLTYLVGFAAAYGGWYWMARMAGLGRWLAQVPGLVFITSAYYITLIYARGDWPEFLAVSTIPLLTASGLSVLRADRLRFWPALALAGSAAVFFGTHNLTIVWGSTTMALVGAMVVVCVPEVRRWLALRRVIRIAGLVVPALLVNAWFLLPAIAYQSHTRISRQYLGVRTTLKLFMSVVSAGHLFTIERIAAVPSARAFVVTLPILAIAWTVVGMAIFLRKGLRGAWTRMLVICAGATALMTMVMTHAPLILALPRPYAMVQFSYRLDSYVLLGISGTMLAVLVLAQGTRGTSTLVWALAPVLIVAVVGAIHQTDAYPNYRGSRQASVRPSLTPGPREEGWIDYIDASLPRLAHVPQVPEIDFPPASLHDDRASKIVHLQPGQPVYTNIGGGPELVHVTGAKIVGISPEGNDVLEVGPSLGSPQGGSGGHGGSPPTEVISVSPASGLPVVLGRLLTLVAAIFLTGELMVLAARRARAGGS